MQNGFLNRISSPAGHCTAGSCAAEEHQPPALSHGKTSWHLFAGHDARFYVKIYGWRVLLRYIPGLACHETPSKAFARFLAWHLNVLL